MAGTIPGFDPDEFRAGIRLAMEVGLPPVQADQPVFHFPAPVTTSGATDGNGAPLDWQASSPTSAPPTPVSVPCAMEYSDAQGRTEGMGLVSASHMVLTFLDEDYEKVKGFSYAVIGGNPYYYQRTLPPMGLGSVGVWQILVGTADEG